MTWWRRVSPRAILFTALGIFLVYAWPGFVGWDTREHLVQARSGVFTDGHPPAVTWVVHICDVLVRGPALLLLFQAITLLAGLYMLLKPRMSERAAALCASAIFLFPPISGVTALIAKDGLMAGPLVIGIALLCEGSPRKQRLALVCVLFASLMRWNALAATFAPVVLLFRWPNLRGVKRYAAAFGVWAALTGVAYEANDLLADQEEHLWYWSYAYQDIAGTLQYAELDEPTVEKLLADTPLRFHDHLIDRFKRVYDPAQFYHLMRDGDQRIWDPPANDAQRDAIYEAWKRFVVDHPAAYFKYRWDNFKLLIKLDRPETWTNVYVWFTVIAAPETIAELGHDASASKIQDKLLRASIWISLTPVYWVFFYFFACIALLAVCVRKPLELSLLLSAIGYQLAWFFLAASTDIRYSQWMELCSVIVMVLVATALLRGGRRARSSS